LKGFGFPLSAKVIKAFLK